MKKFFVLICTVLMMLSTAGMAGAVLINFDDGPQPAFLGPSVGSSYSGFGVEFFNTRFANNFSSFGVTGGSGVVGITAIDTLSNLKRFIWLEEDAVVAKFDFEVAEVSITGLDVGQGTLVINAYDALDGGNLIDFDQAAGGSSVAYQGIPVTLMAAAGAGEAIRRVEIFQLPDAVTEYDGIILDNFEFIQAQAAPVPEPATMLLLGTGLVGLAGFGRKK